MLPEMKNSAVADIIHGKRPCYFVSPHLDDAVLSAGALMSHLSGYTDVHVVNVFTKAGPPPHTRSGLSFLGQLGYDNAELLYKDRQIEDRETLLPVAKTVVNLGFVDALWRRRQRLPKGLGLFGKIIPELEHIYPTYYFHVLNGRIATEDEKTVRQVTEKLRGVITEGVVFCPFGIGGHVDHVIVRTACELLFTDPIYWSDFPYDRLYEPDGSRKYLTFRFQGKTEEKTALVTGYKSQFKALFKDGLELPETEQYFINLADGKSD